MSLKQNQSYHNNQLEQGKISQEVNEKEKQIRVNRVLKAQTNEGKKDEIGVSFESDCLREWHELSGPLTKPIKAKPMQSQTTFDKHLKITV